TPGIFPSSIPSPPQPITQVRLSIQYLPETNRSQGCSLHLCLFLKESYQQFFFNFHPFLFGIIVDPEFEISKQNGHYRTYNVKKTIRQINQGGNPQHSSLRGAAGVPRHQDRSNRCTIL